MAQRRHGIHHESGGSAEGLALFTEWSRGSPKFNEAEIVTMWNSFGRERNGPSITGAYLLSLLPEDHPERSRHKLRTIPTMEERPTTRVFDEPLVAGFRVCVNDGIRNCFRELDRLLTSEAAAPLNFRKLFFRQLDFADCGIPFAKVFASVEIVRIDCKSLLIIADAELEIS